VTNPLPTPCPPTPEGSIFTAANAVSLAGAAATVAWLHGGHPALAVAGLAADAVDGSLARRDPQGLTQTGMVLEAVTDVSLNAVMLGRLGAAWAIPLAVPLQVVGKRAGVGSLRVALTAALLYRQWREGSARPNPSATRAKRRRTR
jgi:phosphatidylglycerophosphate synthase